jgi:hypothetical protein
MRSDLLVKECMKRVNEGELSDEDIVKLLEWVLVSLNVI